MSQAPIHRRPPVALLAYLAALIAVVAVALASFGRHLWCQQGDLVPWSWETGTAHNSQHLLDPYSFTHFEHGLVFFALLWLVARRRSLWLRFALALTLAGAWEVLENSSFIIDRYRAATVDVGYYGDSVMNALADMGWCALGFLVASRLRWYWSLAIMAAFEIGLALTIRDNLLLNIVMLIHPIDGVLAWQNRR
jgi:hypothetical protein